MLFTKSCHHFQEVARIKQELTLVQRRDRNHLPAVNLASLVWDVVADAVQFFNTFPTEDEFSHAPQQSMSISNLAVRRSLLLANLHVPSLDIPAQ